MPTEKEPPAKPTKRPATRNCQYSVAWPISQIGSTVHSISTKKTMRPPNLSVSMPRGRRISDPVSTGVAASRPNWVSLRARTSLIGIPITANSIHTAKQTVNAVVLMMSTDIC